MYAFIFRKEPFVEIKTGYKNLSLKVGSIQEYQDTSSLFKEVVNLEGQTIRVEEPIKGVVITTVGKYYYQREFFNPKIYNRTLDYKGNKHLFYFAEEIWIKIKSTDFLLLLEERLKKEFNLKTISLSLRIHNKISVSLETKDFDFKKINSFCTKLCEEAYEEYLRVFEESVV